MTDTADSYHEHRFDGERRFEIRQDQLTIRGHASLGAKFEQTVPLASLVLPPDRQWARPTGFNAGIWMALIFSSIPLGFGASLNTYWSGLSWVLAIGGVLLSITTARRVEWVTFRNQAGVPLLSVAKSRKDPQGFDRFIGTLCAAITAQRAP